jgi:hypothetical protein
MMSVVPGRLQSIVADEIKTSDTIGAPRFEFQQVRRVILAPHILMPTPAFHTWTSFAEF